MLKPFVIALAMTVPTPANAQMQCADYKEIVKTFADKYGEAVVYVMKSNDGSVVVLLANVETGTWTRVVSNGSGMLCVDGYGTGFKAAPQGEQV